MNNKKKLLIGSLSTAAVVAGVAMTGGTSAYYYDLERSEGNSLSACSLDLVQQGVHIKQVGWAEDDETTVAEEEQSQATSVVTANPEVGTNPGALSTIALDNLQPGDAFEVTIKLKNAGSCHGEMWGDINFPITDKENGMLEPEEAAGDLTPNDAPQDASETPQVGGELDDIMDVTYVTNDAGNSFTGKYRQLAYLPPYLMDDNFTDGEVNNVKVILSVPDNGKAGDGNQIMG